MRLSITQASLVLLSTFTIFVGVNVLIDKTQMKNNITLLILLCLLSFSCQNSKKKEITQLVKNWQGKEIIFPQETIFTRHITDTVSSAMPETDYKVLFFVDSLGCINCKLKLSEWKKFITEAEAISSGSISFLFFFQTKDLQLIDHLLNEARFDHPICIDTNDQLNKLNKFPSDITFQTFLLDTDNKVKIIGNPVLNPAVKKLYLSQLAE